MEFEKINLNNKIFIGVVENVYDKLRKGRIQVRVQSVFNKIPLEHIPWAEPQRSIDGKSFRVPAIGKIVNVIFNNGNIYEPMYIYSENNNKNLQDKLNDMSDTEYEKFIALIYDHRTQIYSDDNGICLDYANNRININYENIDIHLKDNDQTLNLGHEYSNQSAVLGDNFMLWFDQFMNSMFPPTAFSGNIGFPILKPNVDAQITEYFKLRDTFLSNSVKIVDNNSCINTRYDARRNNAPIQDDLTNLNDDKILESKLVDEEVKKKIKEKREQDVDELIENEQNPNSAQIPEEENIQEAEEWEITDNKLDIDSELSIKDALNTTAEEDIDDVSCSE
jgi:hypothetical protein